MHITTTQLPKSQVEMEIEITTEELQPYLVKAAAALSREHPLKGFRPGKVPLDVAVQRYGEMAVYEEAIDPAVRDTFVRAVKEQQLTTVGSPKIEVTKLAPGNSVKYKATVALLPSVTLPDCSGITVTRRGVQVTDADMEKALRDLQHMAPNEALADRAATEQDAVVVDLDLARDGVPVEGGQARNHRINLSEEYELPKVREELVGMCAGAAKTFDVQFPKEHFQQQLAGATLACTVKVIGVYTVTYPVMDDAFAQRLGLDSIIQLRGRIRENIEQEAKQKARQQEDVELLDALADGMATDELPDVLITNEAHRMVGELEQNITQRGLPFADYLEQLKKTRDDILLDMAPEAVRRVKVSLATRAIAQQHPEVCTVEEPEVDARIAQELQRYKDDEGIAERVTSEESRDYVRSMIKSQKIVDWLRTQVQWKEAKAEKAKKK
ncbi:MAG: trigger factor [bacterium]|nr:trigger factor [bacterium]